MKKILFIFMIFLVFIVHVNAELITPESVVEEFGNTTMIKYLNANSNDQTRAVLNTDNHTIDIYTGERLAIRINYTSEYLEYTDNSEITEETFQNQLSDFLYLESIMEAVFRACGYQNHTVDMPEDFEPNYDVYGYDIESEEASFTGENYTLSGDYIRSFKISLDKTKIDKLIADYGVTNVTEDLDTLKAGVKVSASENNKVVLVIAVDTDSDDIYFCDVYRSDKENGTFTKINNESIQCSKNNTSYTDKNVENGKTYYYKVLVLGGSDDVSIVEAKVVEKVKNPKTGVDNQLFYLLYAFFGSILVIAYLSKQKDISLN